MKVFRMLTAGAILMALAAPAYATPVTIDFRGLTDNTSANGEINGTEFLAQGLSLSTLLGSTFNVGCGTGNSCLGADLAAVDDFTGVIRGSFVDNSLNAATAVRREQRPVGDIRRQLQLHRRGSDLLGNRLRL